jgi:hypothetical protein
MPDCPYILLPPSSSPKKVGDQTTLTIAPPLRPGCSFGPASADGDFRVVGWGSTGTVTVEAIRDNPTGTIRVRVFCEGVCGPNIIEIALPATPPPITPPVQPPVSAPKKPLVVVDGKADSILIEEHKDKTLKRIWGKNGQQNVQLILEFPSTEQLEADIASGQKDKVEKAGRLKRFEARIDEARVNKDNIVVRYDGDPNSNQPVRAEDIVAVEIYHT